MIIYGTPLAKKILTELTNRVEKLIHDKGITPALSVIQVDNDPATASYVLQKQKTAQRIGATVHILHFPPTITQESLEETLATQAANPSIHGIVLQLPLPQHLDQEKLLSLIPPTKDIDGFHPTSEFAVPIAKAVMSILEEIYTHIRSSHKNLLSWLKDKQIVVIGKGKTGGKPIIDMLQQEGFTPRIIDTKTKNPDVVMRDADIIITTVGKDHIVTRDTIANAAILIGVGMHKNAQGVFLGDYDENDIKAVASFYTPTPRGVGPVNVAMLMENLVIAAEKGDALTKEPEDLG